MNKVSEIALSAQLFSTPVIWDPAQNGAFAIACVVGREDSAGRKLTAVDAYLADGSRVPGFPALERAPFLIAPGSQIAAGDWDGDGRAELLAVDLEGGIALFRGAGSAPETRRLQSPAHGLLATSPMILPRASEPGGDLLILSQEAMFFGDSRNALGLYDRRGQARPGYPLWLDATPELCPPLLDAVRGHLYFPAPTGHVYGVDLGAARLLPGFPTAPPKVTPGENVSLAFSPKAGSLLLSTGRDALSQLDLRTAEWSKVLWTPGAELSGVVGAGSYAMVVDEAKGRLLCLDERMEILAELFLGWPGPARVARTMTAVLPALVPGPLRTALVLVSCPVPNWPARITGLFAKYGSPEMEREILALADQEAMAVPGKADGSPAERAAREHSIIMMKKGHLHNVLGAERLSEELGTGVETRVQVVTYDGRRLLVALDDLLVDFAPRTALYLSRKMDAALVTGPGGLAEHLVVPLNDARDGAGRSKMCVYRLSN